MQKPAISLRYSGLSDSLAMALARGPTSVENDRSCDPLCLPWAPGCRSGLRRTARVLMSLIKSESNPQTASHGRPHQASCLWWADCCGDLRSRPCRLPQPPGTLPASHRSWRPSVTQDSRRGAGSFSLRPVPFDLSDLSLIGFLIPEVSKCSATTQAGNSPNLTQYSTRLPQKKATPLRKKNTKTTQPAAVKRTNHHMIPARVLMWSGRRRDAHSHLLNM